MNEGDDYDAVKEGNRVKVQFEDGVWYKGNVGSLVKGKVCEVVKVRISYDGGDEEQSNWLDNDTILIDNDYDGKGRKKKLLLEVN